MRLLRRLERVFTSRGDWFRVNAILIQVPREFERTGGIGSSVERRHMNGFLCEFLKLRLLLSQFSVYLRFY